MEVGFDFSHALLWIVLVPLAGAVANGLFGRFASRRLVGALGVGSVAVSFTLAVLAFLKLASIGNEGQLAYTAYEWFSLRIGGSDVPVQIRFAMDSLGGVMTLIVTGVGLLIHIYSIGYMHDDPGYARFFAYLNLFMASMLILVLASNMPLMFVGWEGVGLCSYLLIGFWWENGEFAAAGRKAFVMNRIGDFGVLIGMFILVTHVHSFEFTSINAAAPTLGVTQMTLGSLGIGTVATVACLLLFLGCTGKSAQIPLYTWLPDAMAGPTPVSALIHAATMVTAGVYLCVRLSELFMASTTAMAVVALIGAATALLAASIAVAQNTMKRVLAYSTVSQLGFMFAAVGCGAFAAGVFHVYTHAFFKACLFLGAGSVMHAVGEHSDADIRRLGGLRRFLPTTHWTFLVSCLAIAGVPLFSGFFSKDLILLGAARAGEGRLFETPLVGWLVFALLAGAAVLTAFYMFRLYFMTFGGEYRSAEGAVFEGEVREQHLHHPYDAHPHESPRVMTVPLMVLGAGAVVVGYVNVEPLFVHFDLWGEWLAPRVAAFQAEAHTAHTAAGVGGLAAMALGIAMAWGSYKDKAVDPLPERLPAGLYRMLAEKWRVDELYDALVVRPVRGLAALAGWVDKTFVDGLLTRATSGLVRGGGWLFTRAQTGVVYTYGAVLVIGMAIVAWWFLYPHADLRASEVQGSKVTWSVERGLGYEYRWDVDADGTFDTEWSAENVLVEHDYRERDWKRHVLLVEGARVGEPEEVPISPDKWEILDSSLFGPRWRADPEGGSMPPAIRWNEGRLVIRVNDARINAVGKDPSDGKVQLAPGEGAFLGGTAVRVGAVVGATVEIRNAFGNVIAETKETSIQPSAGDGGDEQEVARAGVDERGVGR